MTQEIKQFEVGRTYATRSLVNHDTVYSFTILARTAKTVTISTRGRDRTHLGITVYEGREQCRPFGMCPIIDADDLVGEG